MATDPVAVSVKPPKARGSWLLSFAFLGLAAGLGVYAYRVREARQADARVLEANAREAAALRTDNAAALHRIGELTAERDKLSGDAAEGREARTRLAATESRLRELEEQHAEVEARLKDFKDVTDKFKHLIDAGTLDVTFRRGRMIVELPASVLFESGSAELSEAGKKAVTEVAKVLAGVPGRRFMVAGHTDNVPAVKEYKSNWALSTTRAVTVLEELVRAGMPVTRVAAAGYAEWDPIASNGSAAGRQKNRRIEIILEPYLTAIPGEDKGQAAGTAPAVKAPAPAASAK